MAQRAVADWSKLKLEYVRTRITIAELAAKYGVKPETVEKQAERNRWGMDRIKFEQLAAAEAAEKASSERVSELVSFNRDDLKVAKAIRARIARRLGAIGAELGATELQMLASAAEAAQRMGRLALGTSTANLRPLSPDEKEPVGAIDLTKYTDQELDLLERAGAVLAGGAAGE